MSCDATISRFQIRPPQYNTMSMFNWQSPVNETVGHIYLGPTHISTTTPWRPSIPKFVTRIFDPLICGRHTAWYDRPIWRLLSK
jgi:hypothetical protein